MANFEHYKTFLKVAELGSMTKAAEELYVSQPAVTQTIKNLEKDLGGTLFIRTNRTLELTAEGKMLYERIKAAVRLVDTAEMEFDQYNELKKGEVRIGVSTILTKLLLIEKITEFKKQYPGIKVIIENGLTQTSMSMLQKGQLDLCIFSKECLDEKTCADNIQKIASLDYCFIFNPAFYDCKNIKDCFNHPFVLQKEKSNTREYINKFFKENGKEPDVSIEVVSNELVLKFVESGLGIGCVYEKLADTSSAVQKIKPDKPFTTDVYAASHNSDMTTAAARAFLKFL